jgi:hypothetical protein
MQPSALFGMPAAGTMAVGAPVAIPRVGHHQHSRSAWPPAAVAAAPHPRQQQTQSAEPSVVPRRRPRCGCCCCRQRGCGSHFQPFRPGLGRGARAGVRAPTPARRAATARNCAPVGTSNPPPRVPGSRRRRESPAQTAPPRPWARRYVRVAYVLGRTRTSRSNARTAWAVILAGDVRTWKRTRAAARSHAGAPGGTRSG